MIKIPYVNLSAQWFEERDELLLVIENVLASGQYVGGREVEKFEQRIASLCGTKYCVALNSGTDALILGLSALGVKTGDEVITPPNSFIASTAAIVHLGAKPVFVDVLPDQNLDPGMLESSISAKTKAIMPVHLTGRMAKMDKIISIADKYGIPVIEDAAQAIGSCYQGKPSGKWGKAGCFSAHPLKNLNACGDCGFIVTDDDLIASNIRLFRNHGLVDRNIINKFGMVSRMDAIQAAILNFRTSKLETVINKRRENASLYFQYLDQENIFLPEEHPDEFNTYHTFVIQVDNRDKVLEGLRQAGVESAIHYPIPIHLQPAAEYLGYKKGSFPVAEKQAGRILTLPVHQYLTKQEIIFIANQVNLLCNS